MAHTGPGAPTMLRSVPLLAVIDVRPPSAEPASLPQVESSLLTAVWRHKFVVITAVCLGALLGFATSVVQPVRYSAEARLFLATSRPFTPLAGSDQFVEPGRYVGNQAEIASSMPVLVRAEKLLQGSTDVETLRRSVRAVAASNLDRISIIATAPTADGAVARAQAVASAYQGLVEEQVMLTAQQVVEEIDAAVVALERDLPDMSNAERDLAFQQVLDERRRGRDALLQASIYGDGIALAERPEVPSSPYQPKPVRNALVAGVLGLLAAAAFALYREDRAARGSRPQLANAEERSRPRTQT